ncbi:MAG TPA: alpha/beta hydrolase [Dehalococcoidia bacterium]
MPPGKYERTGLRPEVAGLLDAARAAKAGQTEPTRIPMLRAIEKAAAVALSAGAPAIALEREVAIKTPDVTLRALVFAPVEQPEAMPVIMHLHGGGFVWMLPESYAKPSKEIAIAANAIVVSIDYRRAPEHPYPTPLDDCVAAFRWLRAHATEIGGDPSRIAIAGESAGGGLAASTTLRLLADGDEPPAAVAVASAWLDLRNASPSFRALGPDDPMIDEATMAYWRESYAPREEQWSDPMLSPVLADVSSFPPACVVVAGIDPLYDDGVSFAESLRAAGRSVELHDYEGMPHIFWCFPQLDGVNDVTDRIGAFFRRELQAGA